MIQCNIDYNNFIIELIANMEFLIFSGKCAQNLNLEQKTAVVNIVECSNEKLPYILYGPPGLILARLLYYW